MYGMEIGCKLVEWSCAAQKLERSKEKESKWRHRKITTLCELGAL